MTNTVWKLCQNAFESVTRFFETPDNRHRRNMESAANDMMRIFRGSDSYLPMSADTYTTFKHQLQILSHKERAASHKASYMSWADLGDIIHEAAAKAGVEGENAARLVDESADYKGGDELYAVAMAGMSMKYLDKQPHSQGVAVNIGNSEVQPYGLYGRMMQAGSGAELAQLFGMRPKFAPGRNKRDAAP